MMEGRSILQKISGIETAKREFDEITESLKQKRATMRELFKPGLRTALMVGIGLSVFGQLTGVNAVIYYGPLILEQTGIQLGNALQFQIMFGIY